MERKGKHPLLQGQRRHLSPKELADVLELSQSTVTRQCNEGRILASKPAGRWRIPLAEAVRLERLYFPEIDQKEDDA